MPSGHIQRTLQVDFIADAFPPDRSERRVGRGTALANRFTARDPWRRSPAPRAGYWMSLIRCGETATRAPSAPIPDARPGSQWRSHRDWLRHGSRVELGECRAERLEVRGTWVTVAIEIFLERADHHRKFSVVKLWRWHRARTVRRVCINCTRRGSPQRAPAMPSRTRVLANRSAASR